MPVNKHLRYYDLSDFSSGVFTEPGSGNQLIMNANGAQQLDDAYPQKEGGLRAFFKSVSLTTSGVVAPTQESCTGLYVISGYARRAGPPANSTGTVRYMTTWNNVTNVARIYRMDGTGGELTWQVKFTSVTTADNAADRRFSSFARFTTTAGVDYCVIVMRSGLESSSRGVFVVKYDGTVPVGTGTDGQVTRVNGFAGPLCVSQGRIIVGENAAATSMILHWGTLGDITFSGATSGQVTPQPNKNLNGIALIAEFDPDQILLGFNGAPWVTITGDINSATAPIRQMGDAHYPGSTTQDPIRTPNGIVFLESHGSAYRTDGRTFTPLTTHLAPFTGAFPGDGIGGLGSGAFLQGFLFLPGGLVMHEESGGWFKTSDHVTACMAADIRNGVISSVAGVSFTLRERLVSREEGVRNSAWTWRSAPFAQPDGTQTEVREVVVQNKCYATSTLVITVTDHLGNTTVQTAANIAAGKHATAIPILARGDYADVKIAASANNGTSEAPTVEKVRLGFGRGHAL